MQWRVYVAELINMQHGSLGFSELIQVLYIRSNWSVLNKDHGVTQAFSLD